MFCNKCGQDMGQNSFFCSNCGNQMNNNVNTNTNVSNNNGVSVMYNNTPNNMNVNMNYNNQNGFVNNQDNYQYNQNINNGYNMNNNSNLNSNMNVSSNSNMAPNNKPKSNKTLIFILCGVVVVLVLIIMVVMFVKKDDSASGYDDGVLDTRTIMIYLCGSDLESNIALATSDLESIKASEIDLEAINIVVYTGGASKWYNYVSSEENAIYVLEESGFVKKETYDKSSMGSSSSLKTLLDYSYENYKADKYDLIMWNHGLGSLGISSDEQFRSDYLSLDELTEALSKSPFNQNNKFETVIFRSCLNSTLEMASVFVPYANYFVASEEVTWGATGSKVLNFLNDVELEDSGVDVGKKFIDSYEVTLNTIATKSGYTLDEAFPVSTYAIIDLSKVNELENKLGLFFKSLNLDLNYNNIARVRSNLYQYASESGCNDYDTVDLYQLVNGLKSLSSSKADDVLKVLDEAVVYNWSNNSFSNGLAIYFPYNSSSRVRTLHYSSYKNLSGLSDYYTFIKNFDSLQKSASSGGGFSVVSKEDIKISVNNKKLSLELDDENVDNYAKASYIIFEKSGTNYIPVYTSDTFELGKSNYSMNLDMSLLKITNKDNNTSKLLSLYTNQFNNLYTDASLSSSNGTYNAKVYFKDLKITKVTMADTESSKGMYLDINDYTKIGFVNNSYNLLNNGEVIDNWEDNPIEASFEVGGNYGLEKVSLDSNYYVMFKIYDVDNLFVYSDLIQIK